MQRAPASHVGPTQYVQIVWAVVLGAIFFHESQDVIGYAGLALLVLAGVATIFSDGAQARISGRWAEFRARRGEPEINPRRRPRALAARPSARTAPASARAADSPHRPRPELLHQEPLLEPVA